MIPFAPIVGGVLIAIAVGVGFEAVGSSGSDIYSGSVDQTRTFAAQDISTVHVDTDVAEVHVLQGSGSTIQVHVYGDARGAGNRLRFDAKSVNSNLDVRVKHPWTDSLYNNFSWLGIGGQNPVRVDIEVPDGVYENLVVDDKAGDVVLDDFAIGDINVASSAGNVRASNVHGTLKAFTHAGEITMQNVDGPMDLATNAGNITIQENSIQNDVTAHTSAGWIELNTATAPTSLRYGLKTSYGTVDTNLPYTTNSSNGVSDFQGSIGTGGPRVDLSSGVGNISLNVK